VLVRAVPRAAVFYAQAWTCFGYPSYDPDAIEWVLRKLKLPPLDELDDRRVGAQVDVLQALADQQYLPPVRREHTRLLHSIGLGSGSHVAVERQLLAILREGIRPTKDTMAHHHLVFGLADNPKVEMSTRLYAHRVAWVAVDLPWRWPGWGDLDAWGEPGGVFGAPTPGSVLIFSRPVPPSFIVGVNGLPVRFYPRRPVCTQ